MPDDEPADRPDDQPHPLSEAEEPRSRPHEALARTSRLISASKRRREQTEVVQAAVQSLREPRGLGE